MELLWSLVTATEELSFNWLSYPYLLSLWVKGRFPYVEAKSLDFGWCSMDTVPRGYCSRSAPFLTPKHPTNVAPYFSSPGLALTLVPCCRLLPSTGPEGAFILAWPRPPDSESRDEAATAAWCPPVRGRALPVSQGASRAWRQQTLVGTVAPPFYGWGNWDVREKLSKTETDNSQRKESKLPAKLRKSCSDSQAAKEKQTALAMRHPSLPVTLANGSEGSSFQWWQECGKSGGHRPCETAWLLQPLRELTSQ